MFTDASNSNDGTVIGLPSLGYHETEMLEDPTGFYLQHGSSLILQMKVGEFLNSSNVFSGIDVSSDWEKWQRRSTDFSLYYAATFDQSTDSIVGALRAITDGHPSPRPPHKRRLIIDYVAVLPSYQNKGLSSSLVKFVMNVSSMSSANVYVLAIEETCVYWMSKGFLLCENVNLNARLNIFPDTHLLRHAENDEDDGDVADLSMQEEFEEDEEDEEDDGEEEMSPPPSSSHPTMLDFTDLLNQHNMR